MSLRPAASRGITVSAALLACCATTFAQVAAPRTPASPTTHPAVDATVPFQERLDGVIAKGVCRVLLADVRGEQYGSGSGFLVTADGFVITNHHVVEGAASATVEFPEVPFTGKAQLWQSWPQFDLALLKLDMTRAPAQLLPLPIAPARTNRSAAVWTLGFPLSRDLSLTITQGNVNALRDRKQFASVVSSDVDKALVARFDPAICFVQIDSTINRGNSGGPLIDGRGYVVGVNSLSLTTANDFYLAVSAEHVSGVIAARRPQPAGFTPGPARVARQPAQPAGSPYPPPPGVPANYPGEAAPVAPPPRPREVKVPELGARFYHYDAPVRRQPITAASAAARELTQLRLQSCPGCGGKGRISYQERVGTRREGMYEYPVMQTRHKNCEKCGATGKVPPKEALVQAAARRLASTLAATDAAATGAIDEASDAQSAELLRRIEQTAWKDVAEWGQLVPMTREMLDRPVPPGQPVVTLGRIAGVIADASAPGGQRYAVASPLIGWYFVTGRLVSADNVAVGDRVAIFGVTGAQQAADGSQWIAVHGGAMRRCN